MVQGTRIDFGPGSRRGRGGPAARPHRLAGSPGLARGAARGAGGSARVRERHPAAGAGPPVSRARQAARHEGGPASAMKASRVPIANLEGSGRHWKAQTPPAGGLRVEPKPLPRFRDFRPPEGMEGHGGPPPSISFITSPFLSLPRSPYPPDPHASRGFPVGRQPPSFFYFSL